MKITITLTSRLSFGGGGPPIWDGAYQENDGPELGLYPYHHDMETLLMFLSSCGGLTLRRQFQDAIWQGFKESHTHE